MSGSKSQQGGGSGRPAKNAEAEVERLRAQIAGCQRQLSQQSALIGDLMQANAALREERDDLRDRLATMTAVANDNGRG